MNTTQRWGTRMGDAKMLDMMTGALSDPFEGIHMGVTAENVAAKCGITRAQQDEFAVESHRRAAAAIAAGHFKSQILPIELKSKKGPIQFDTDEHVRTDVVAGKHGQAEGGVPERERHRHRGQRVGHQRCRRGGRADGEIGRRRQGIQAAGAPLRPTVTPASIRASWAWARHPPSSARSRKPA